MKKIVAFILMCSMLLTFVPSVMAAESGTVCDEYTVDRIFGLGLIPHTTRAEYQANAPITRSELAWIMETITKYEQMTNSTEFTWQFYGNGTLDSSVLKLPPAPQVPTFEDVPASYWAYEIIEAVYAEGLMNGVSSNSFAPDNTVTIEQLAKCFVSILGYDSKAQHLGGYPSGYTKVANDLGLLKGVAAGATVTNADLIKMIDNALDAKIMVFDGISGDDSGEYIIHSTSGETFLTGILGLDLAEGVMTDNSVTALFGQSRVDENQFVVDNTLLKADEDYANSLYDYIGREVEAYYVNDPKSKKADHIVYAALTGFDEATVIDAQDFIDFDNGVINYFEGDDTEKISLSNVFALIYNGQAKTSYTEETFDIECGQIIVVEGTTDVVIINEYDTWYVAGVDQNGQIIYNKLMRLEVNGKEVRKTGTTFADLDDYKFITIIKPDGNLGTLADITPGTLLDVAINGDSITICINNKMEIALVDGLAQEGNKKIIISGEKEYTVSNKYLNSENCLEYDDNKNPFFDLNIKIGQELILYIDKFGTVSWIENNDASTTVAPVNYKAGYIMNMALDTEEMKDIVLISLFDGTDKKEVIYKCNPDRTVVSDERGKETTYKNASALFNAISGYSYYNNPETGESYYSGIVRYLLDDNSNITYIEFPITDVYNQKEGKLNLIIEEADTDKDNGEEGGGMKFRYNNFGAKAITADKTVVFSVDTTKAGEEKGYDVSNVGSTFSNEKYYNGFEIYTTHKDSKLGEYMVYYTKSKAAQLVYNTGIKFAIVKSITNVYDEELAQSVPAIKAFTGTISSSTTVNANGVLKLSPECTITPVLTKEGVVEKFEGELEPGDFIFYGTDIDGYVDDIKILWDQNGVNPDSPDGAPGTIVNSKGYYGTGDDAPKFLSSNIYDGDITKLPNPLTLATDATYGQVAKTSKSFASGPLAIQYGFLSRYRDGAIEITTQDITVEDYDPTGLDGKHVTRVWTTPTNSVVITLSGKDNVEVLQGGSVALAPFRPQDEYAQNCSRMIVFSNYAMMSKLFVINGYFEE